MPVIDVKPQNNKVLNVTPNNKAVLNTLPQNQGIRDTNFVYLENKTINQGSPMGLLLALTYPTTVNFVGPRI